GASRAVFLAGRVLGEKTLLFERFQYTERGALADGEGPGDLGDAERLVLPGDELDDPDGLFQDRGIIHSFTIMNYHRYDTVCPGPCQQNCAAYSFSPFGGRQHVPHPLPGA